MMPPDYIAAGVQIAPPASRPAGTAAVSARAAGWEAAGVALLAASLVIGFQLYLQNVHIVTTNGLWKSIDVRRWIADPSWKRLDFANILYFPVQAMSCSLLERLGIFPGQIWRQLALMNGLFGGIGAGAVYLFTLGWMRSRAVALLTAVLYVGSGFYLLLSVINEDIMPGAVLILIASLLACAWFGRPTYRQIAIVGVVFGIAWLWEWRLLFPSLPAMGLALLLARGRWVDRLLRPSWFLAAMAIPPFAIAVLFRLMRAGGIKAAVPLFVHMFWAGKGVGTGWGGFTTTKVALAWGGIAESVTGAQNIGSWGAWRVAPTAREFQAGTLILLLLAALAITYAWRHRRDSRVIAAVAVLGGTLLAGTVFNLYSQPQDPQMVINVMIWTVAGWALLARAALRIPQHWVRNPVAAALLSVPLVLASLWPLGYNLHALAKYRGLDPVFESAVRRLDHRFDPVRTVFLYQGFEGAITWQYVMLGGEYVEVATLPPADAAGGDLKYMDVTSPAIQNPHWTPQQVAASVQARIDAALQRGYQVAASPSFRVSTREWLDGLATVSNPAVFLAVRNMIEQRYQLTPAFNDPTLGEYSILTRRDNP